MSAAEGPLRTPSLADTFADIDRRVRAVEFGDPNAVADARARIASINASIASINASIVTINSQIAQLSSQMQGVHDSSVQRDNVLHVNDGNLYTWATQYAPPVRTWQTGNLKLYIEQRADWAVLWHEYARHGLSNPGPGPVFNGPPALPAWPIITDPTP
jgi:hypothetical protein